MDSPWDVLRDEAQRRKARDKREVDHRRRILGAHADEARTVASISSRTEKSEQTRTLRAEQEQVAEQFNGEVQARLEEFHDLLRVAAGEPSRDVDAIGRHEREQTAPTADDVSVGPAPDWEDYAPAPPKLFRGRRFERDYEQARRMFDDAVARHQATVHEAVATARRAFAVKHDASWARTVEAVYAGEPASVAELAGRMVAGSSALRGLLEGGRASYEFDPRELVLEVDLPEEEVLPRERGWKYAISKKAVEPVPPLKDQPADWYWDLIAKIVLAVLDACFRGFPVEIVASIAVNGHVQTTDRATGRPTRPCVISVSVDREKFSELDLGHAKLDPSACLRRLGAAVSPHPYALTPIKPMVDFELSQYRIAYGPEALAKLDHRMDLLTMDPYEFERLVQGLFAKMGYDTWRTESSGDDGIDAVATRSDPHMPVECVVQAKRVKRAVAPKEVQALMGAMTERATATHGYLVTTSWLSPRSRQRARDQRIHTIERNELASMIKDLLGYEVLISNSPPPGSAKPDR